MDITFPVVSETTLHAPPKRVLGIIPSKRSPGEIPPHQPGTVLVFGDSAGNWTQARGRVVGTESFVVNAVSVSLVQTRVQAVDVQIRIPSASDADDFIVKVQFNCRVVSPELVAERGPTDLSKTLADFLRRDRGLLVKGQDMDVENVKTLRRIVDARVRAYCDETNPDIPGMDVVLSSVEVTPPPDYILHATKVRDTKWGRVIAEMLGAHEDADVRRLAVIFENPETIAALGHLKDKIDMEKMLSESLADRRAKDANILELLKVLEKNGQLDRLPIKATALVNTLMDRLAGAGAGHHALGDGADDHLLAIDSDTLRSIDAAHDRKEERFVVDNHADE